MAQSWATKQQTWQFRFQNALVNFMTDADALTLLLEEFANNDYASGAANAMTDAIVQEQFPAGTAALLFFVVGSLNNSGAILPTIATARPAMETFRP